MNPRLQAGIELTIEKEAREQSGAGLLSSVLQRNAPKFGLGKAAGEQDQGVVQEAASGAGSASSNKSPGMEDKNKDYGKGEVKLDDDPTKNGSVAKETGQTDNVHAGPHITTENGGAMPDLSKNASDRRTAIKTILGRYSNV